MFVHHVLFVMSKGGRPPRDGIILTLKQAHLAPGLYICMCFLAAFGILLATAFLAFNVAFREKK